jgi:hypothetical protein
MTATTFAGFQPGTHVYDVNTKQTGVLTSAPYVSDSGMRQVADVRWDNGDRAVIFTSHLRAYAS